DIEVPADVVGAVVELAGQRRGTLLEMRYRDDGTVHCVYRIPTRGLLGFRQAFLTRARGQGVMNTLFADYGAQAGPIAARTLGSPTGSGNACSRNTTAVAWRASEGRPGSRCEWKRRPKLRAVSAPAGRGNDERVHHDERAREAPRLHVPADAPAVPHRFVGRRARRLRSGGDAERGAGHGIRGGDGRQAAQARHLAAV